MRRLGLERHDQHDGERGEEQDAVGEREPVAAGVQLARQVAVLGEDRAEHREAVERGVRGQDQDQRGRADDDVEAAGKLPNTACAELRRHRFG